MKLRRANTSWNDDTALENITYNDKYVVVYEFGDTGSYALVDVLSQGLTSKTLRPLFVKSVNCFEIFTRLD
jgi:hypothetical protein